MMTPGREALRRFTKCRVLQGAILSRTNPGRTLWTGFCQVSVGQAFQPDTTKNVRLERLTYAIALLANLIALDDSRSRAWSQRWNHQSCRN